jgi:uncharacterized protein YdiU (UPF0061 family)
MAGLGIPTTRALALVVSDDPVYRETVESAAVLTRVSPTFVRFGSFEHWWNHPQNCRLLMEYVVSRFYPECHDPAAGETNTGNDVALRFLGKVVVRTAELVAAWQTAGFCHGVMNTDNMSIIGLTLDYGPYGFIDRFRADHVCNHSDTMGRYAWNAQPAVANWNLGRLANSLVALGIDPAALKQELLRFEPAFLQAYRNRMAEKFGLPHWRPDDENLVDDWWQLLHDQHADFTLSFRNLSTVMTNADAFLDLFAERAPARAWLARYVQRVEQEPRPDPERVAAMDGVNPLYVLRNHLAEAAIQAAQRGDAGEIDTLLELLRNPYKPLAGRESYAAAAPEWASSLEVSCSS